MYGLSLSQGTGVGVGAGVGVSCIKNTIHIVAAKVTIADVNAIKIFFIFIF
jgi:hypothetical protein